MGQAYGRRHSYDEAERVTSIGTGFRYFVAKKLGLTMGVDVARSNGENAFYIQVGSDWK